jgi:hypothetical protein
MGIVENIIPLNREVLSCVGMKWNINSKTHLQLSSVLNHKLYMYNVHCTGDAIGQVGSPALGLSQILCENSLNGRVYFRVGQGVLSPPPGIDLPPLEIGFPYSVICECPLGFIFAPPPLKFAAMCFPPLEQNPEINPEWWIVWVEVGDVGTLTCMTIILMVASIGKFVWIETLHAANC